MSLPLIITKWIALASLSLATASASALTLTLTLDSVVPWTPVSGHAGSANFANVPAGLLNFTVTAQSGTGPIWPGSLALYCVEMQQHIQLGSSGNVYSLVAAETASSGIHAGHSANISLAGIGTARAHNLEVLYAHVFGSTYNPGALTAVQKSAFQLAVWELSHDDGFNLTSGAGSQFWITSGGAPVSQARSWVDWVAANFSTAPVMELTALHNSQKQDFLLPTSLAFSAIPEPSTYALAAGACILALVVSRRKGMARV